MGNVPSVAAASGHSGDAPPSGSLSEAAANGDVASVSSILKSAPTADAASKLSNSSDRDGWTPVHFAAYGGSVPALDLLLSAGGDPTARDKGGRTPLHLAALRGNVAGAASLLKAAATAGGNRSSKGRRSSGVALVNSADSHGMTALHKAAVAGHAKMVELLVKLGADPSAAASDGSTPAHMAAFKGQVEALRVLLVSPEGGKAPVASPVAKRKDGQTPLSEAASQGHEAAVSFLLSLPGVRATVAEADKSGATAIDLAAANGHSRVVAELRRAAGLPAAAPEPSAASALAPGGGESGAYPSLYQPGASSSGAAAAPAASEQGSWWAQALGAVAAAGGASATAATPASAPVVVDQQAAKDWWSSAIGQDASSLPPPPKAAVKPAAAGEKKAGVLDDREAFEAAALAKAQGLYRALAGKRKPAAATAAASAAQPSGPGQVKLDLEPYDSDDYEEEAPTSGADERPLPARTARERAAISARLAQLELAADAAHGWTRGGSKGDGKAAREAREAIARQEREIEFLKRQLAVAAGGRPSSRPPAFLDSRTPLEFVCPITRQVMRDPVYAADGRSYERAAITAYLQAGNVASPVTGERLGHPALMPNVALKNAIDDFNRRNAAGGGGGFRGLSFKRQPAYA